MAFLISRCFNRVRQEVEYESLRQIFSVWSCYPDGSVSLRDFLWLDERCAAGDLWVTCWIGLNPMEKWLTWFVMITIIWLLVVVWNMTGL